MMHSSACRPDGDAVIGVVQEYRTKKSLDRLVVLGCPRALVLHDGAVQQIAKQDVVRYGVPTEGWRQSHCHAAFLGGQRVGWPDGGTGSGNGDHASSTFRY